METPNILSEEEIHNRLKDLPGWSFANDKITKEYSFHDFMDSLNFVVGLAPFFEENDHHPDIHIFYSKIVFDLQRFDVGGKVTDKDFLVAGKIEATYRART